MTVEQYLQLMEEVRERTFYLVEPLSESAIVRQHNPLMSPIKWDIGHIANFEELWFLQQALNHPPINEKYNYIYNALTKPRNERERLPLPSLDETVEYLRFVRSRVSEHLHHFSMDAGDPLLRGGFLFELVIRHEMQHQETMLIAMQMMDQGTYTPPERRPVPEGKSRENEMTYFPGGEFVMGWDRSSFAYDNEQPAHRRVVEPFYIDTVPVTAGDYLQFIRAGGYGRREFWSEEGWRWKEEAAADAPMFWKELDGAWYQRRFDEVLLVSEREPVSHVNYHEAEAYCRFAGKRLPTETEWEYAASWIPESGEKLQYPWGESPDSEFANWNQLEFGPAEVGAFPLNQSPGGCFDMIGGIWEWTSSDFQAYPGFEAFPYPEYSEIFFGDEYKVLRGGSWATMDRVISTTFRNWDFPIRQQIFAGFRCARDAE